jgi:hypothetical protein
MRIIFDPVPSAYCKEISRHRTSPLSLPRWQINGPKDTSWSRFRIMARRDARSVRLFSRSGYNFGDRFPLIARAIEASGSHVSPVHSKAAAVRGPSRNPIRARAVFNLYGCLRMMAPHVAVERTALTLSAVTASR